jgi:hypothetical protein
MIRSGCLLRGQLLPSLTDDARYEEPEETAEGCQPTLTHQVQPWSVASLPLGSVKPGGWLQGEIQAMTNGLAGHEHEAYAF